MRQSTSANTERPPNAPPLEPLGGAPDPECVAGEELGLIIRDVCRQDEGSDRATRLLERDGEATGCDLRVRDRPSRDRLSLATGRSGFVGRVPVSGRMAGEPLTAEPDTDHDAAQALAERLREQHLHRHYGERPRAARRVHRRRPVASRHDRGPATRSRRRRVASSQAVGGGTVAGAGDVAAGASRGVAGASDRVVPARHDLTGVGDSRLGM